MQTHPWAHVYVTLQKRIVAKLNAEQSCLVIIYIHTEQKKQKNPTEIHIMSDLHLSDFTGSGSRPCPRRHLYSKLQPISYLFQIHHDVWTCRVLGLAWSWVETRGVHHYEYCLQRFALKNDENFGRCQYFLRCVRGRAGWNDRYHTYCISAKSDGTARGCLSEHEERKRGETTESFTVARCTVWTPGSQHTWPRNNPAHNPNKTTRWGWGQDQRCSDQIKSHLTVYYSIKSCRSVWLRVERSYTHRQAEQSGKQRTRWSGAKVSACLLWTHDYFQKCHQRAVCCLSHSQYAFIGQVSVLSQTFSKQANKHCSQTIPFLSLRMLHIISTLKFFFSFYCIIDHFCAEMFRFVPLTLRYCIFWSIPTLNFLHNHQHRSPRRSASTQNSQTHWFTIRHDQSRRCRSWPLWVWIMHLGP